MKDNLLSTIRKKNIAETAIKGFQACFPDSVLGFIPDEKKANVHYVDYVISKLKNKLIMLSFQTAPKNINLGTFEQNKNTFKIDMDYNVPSD